jgi:hypothetical protein
MRERRPRSGRETGDAWLSRENRFLFEGTQVGMAGLERLLVGGLFAALVMGDQPARVERST